MDPVIIALVLMSGLGLGASLTSLYVWSRTRDDTLFMLKSFMNYLDAQRMSRDINYAALLIRSNPEDLEEGEELSDDEREDGEDDADPFGTNPDWWKS